MYRDRARHKVDYVSGVAPDHRAGTLHHSARARSLFHGSRRLAGQLVNGGEHFAPMPERNANLFEILACQILKYGNINLVVDEALDVLGHSELFEPIRNLLHYDRAPITVRGRTFSPGSEKFVHQLS
jgi:hypothetical protein